MEESVRTLLQYKARCELLNQEKVILTAAYESKVHQYQKTINKLGHENESLKRQVQFLGATETGEFQTALWERLRILEAENANLSRDADFQRKQYERCLDDIANQVIRALLSQKELKEEIGNLQKRIKELETQNHALANTLVQKLENNGFVLALPSIDNTNNEIKNDFVQYSDGNLSLNENNFFENTEGSTLAPPTISTFKSIKKKRLKRFSFNELKDKNILRSFESLVLVPFQKPRSLNLQLQPSPKAVSSASKISSNQCQSKKTKLRSLVDISKKSTEDEGNESPESRNRDEGYSTMSSDVQALGETNELSKRELEDLKEASDETEIILNSNGDVTSLVVVEEMSNPEIFFVPLSLSLSYNPRHSYPPTKEFIPFQHIMRSFSDSHLSLKFTSTSSMPSPLISSVILVDLLEKFNHLKRNKATSTVLSNEKNYEKTTEDTNSITGSWCGGVIESSWWDTEYVQHWMNLDDTILKQQHKERDFLQLEYDRTEIEDWTMSLSCEDITKSDDLIVFHDQNTISPSILSGIQEITSIKIDEDLNEWQDYSCVNFTTDSKHEVHKNWIHEENKPESFWQIPSPDGSWSSIATNNSDECYLNEPIIATESKYSLASDSVEVPSTIGVDFTRDFYRLVKFESTKSLASNSSRSNMNFELRSNLKKQLEDTENRALTLQSVLSFIAEQQRYCHYREEDYGHLSNCTSPSNDSLVVVEKDCQTVIEKEKNNLSVDIIPSNLINKFCPQKTDVSTEKKPELPNGCAEELASKRSSEINITLQTKSNIKKNRDTVVNGGLHSSSCLKDPENKKYIPNLKKHQLIFNKKNTTKLPIRNSKTDPLTQTSLKPKKIQKKKNSVFQQNSTEFSETDKAKLGSDNCDENSKSSARACSNNISNKPENSEFISNKKISRSYSSSILNSKTIISKLKETKECNSDQTTPIKIRETGIPVSISRKVEENTPLRLEKKPLETKLDSKTRGTKIPIFSTRKSKLLLTNKPKQFNVISSKPCFSKNLVENGDLLNRSKQVDTFNSTSKTSESSNSEIINIENASFHDQALAKDMINKLNRMIRKGEEIIPSSLHGEMKPLDMACCCPTGWVHVERNIDFADPKARANLLDVMLASSGSSGGSGSSSESDGDELVDYTDLHQLNRFHMQGKGMISNNLLKSSSSSNNTELFSPEIDVGTPVTPTTPSDDSDERTGGHLSLSDSCADSFSGSMGSFEENS